MVGSARVTAAVLAALLILSAQPPHGARALQQPPRDTSAPRANPTPPSARIAGTVVTADTGKPVKRVRVNASTWNMRKWSSAARTKSFARIGAPGYTSMNLGVVSSET